MAIWKESQYKKLPKMPSVSAEPSRNCFLPLEKDYEVYISGTDKKGEDLPTLSATATVRFVAVLGGWSYRITNVCLPFYSLRKIYRIINQHQLEELRAKIKDMVIEKAKEYAKLFGDISAEEAERILIAHASMKAKAASESKRGTKKARRAG